MGVINALHSVVVGTGLILNLLLGTHGGLFNQLGSEVTVSVIASLLVMSGGALLLCFCKK